jgi:hypothetical protein
VFDKLDEPAIILSQGQAKYANEEFIRKFEKEIIEAKIECF